MNITENLQRIQKAKTDIKDAISQKGVYVDDSLTIDNFADKILQIEGGGGGDTLSEYFNNTLTSCTIPNGVTSIINSLFSNKTKLKNVSIPNTVTRIGVSAFTQCSGLTSINIPNSVKTIENYAFNGCSGATSLNIGNSVTSIGEYAFNNCRSIGNLVFPNSLKTIGAYAFYYLWRITNVNIPDSVKTIGQNAFYNTNQVTSITLGKRLNTIGDYAFQAASANSSKLSSIYCKGILPPTIGTRTFNNNNYTGGVVHVPTGSKSSYTTALFTTNNLSSSKWTIVDDLEYIPENQLVCKFNITSTSATRIKYSNAILSGNTAWINDSNPQRLKSTAYTFTTTGEHIIKYDECDDIPSNAFSGVTTLTSLEIPNGTDTIGTAICKACTSLTAVTWDSSQQFIQNNSFSGCTKLKVIDFSNSATQVIRFGSSATDTTTGSNNYLPTTIQYIVVPDSLYSSFYSSTYWTYYKTKLISKSNYDAL